MGIHVSYFRERYEVRAKHDTSILREQYFRAVSSCSQEAGLDLVSHEPEGSLDHHILAAVRLFTCQRAQPNRKPGLPPDLHSFSAVGFPTAGRTLYRLIFVCQRLARTFFAFRFQQVSVPFARPTGDLLPDSSSFEATLRETRRTTLREGDAHPSNASCGAKMPIRLLDTGATTAMRLHPSVVEGVNCN